MPDSENVSLEFCWMSLRAWPRSPRRLEHLLCEQSWNMKGVQTLETDPEGEPSAVWLPQDTDSPSAHTNCSFLHAHHSSRVTNSSLTNQDQPQGHPWQNSSLQPPLDILHQPQVPLGGGNTRTTTEKTARIRLLECINKKAVTVTQRTISYIQIKQYQFLTLLSSICIWMICYESITLETPGDGQGKTQVWKSHHFWLCIISFSTITENWLEPSNQNRIPTALIIIS